jgi:hypothetical protein
VHIRIRERERTERKDERHIKAKDVTNPFALHIGSIKYVPHPPTYQFEPAI